MRVVKAEITPHPASPLKRRGFWKLRSASLALLWVASFASGAITIPDPGSFVVDRAGVVDGSTEQQLEGWLRELEQKTTAQVKVLTVATTDGEDVFGFCHRHAEQWKLGRQGKDNGALLCVAMKEREARIHPGYGLEAIMPDGWCGSLLRSVVESNFKQGRFSEGIRLAAVAMANKIADSTNTPMTGVPDFRHRRSTRPQQVVGGGLGGMIFILIVVLIAVSRRRRYRHRWGGGFGEAVFWGSVIGDLMGGGRRYGGRGGFGSGFGGGGGFGGFGGSFGGGGRFGGGGGGARW